MGEANQDTRSTQATQQPERMPLFTSIERPEHRNIVIFGETGTGKSSIINMLADGDVASVSNHPEGCTFESKAYPITIDGVSYTIWDTAGLNEAEAGTVPAGVALHRLQDLVGNLSAGGLSLLVYCIRGSRYRDILKVNYDLFWGIICRGEVPIVLVVTGLENEVPMDGWWDVNEKQFTRRDMNFSGHACVTATKGKRNVFEAEYQESIKVVRDLISTKCPEDARGVASKELWLQQIALSIPDYFIAYNSYSAGSTTHGQYSTRAGYLPRARSWAAFLWLLSKLYSLWRCVAENPAGSPPIPYHSTPLSDAHHGSAPHSEPTRN